MKIRSLKIGDHKKFLIERDIFFQLMFMMTIKEICNLYEIQRQMLNMPFHGQFDEIPTKDSLGFSATLVRCRSKLYQYDFGFKKFCFFFIGTVSHQLTGIRGELHKHHQKVRLWCKLIHQAAKIFDMIQNFELTQTFGIG